MIYELEDIKKFLPHRPPMLLVERAEILEDGTAVGWYTVKGDEWFVQGHFPDRPIVPGVVLCEMMGQSMGVLLKDMPNLDTKTPILTGIDKARFHHPVKPGDTFKSVVKVKRVMANTFYTIEGKGYIGEDDTLCLSATLGCAVVDSNKV